MDLLVMVRSLSGGRMLESLVVEAWLGRFKTYFEKIGMLEFAISTNRWPKYFCIFKANKICVKSLIYLPLCRYEEL